MARFVVTFEFAAISSSSLGDCCPLSGEEDQREEEEKVVFARENREGSNRIRSTRNTSNTDPHKKEEEEEAVNPSRMMILQIRTTRAVALASIGNVYALAKAGIAITHAPPRDQAIPAVGKMTKEELWRRRPMHDHYILIKPWFVLVLPCVNFGIEPDPEICNLLIWCSLSMRKGALLHSRAVVRHKFN